MKDAKLFVILKSILFWVLFSLSLAGSSFLAYFFPKDFNPMALGIFGSLAAFLITWLFLKYEKKGFDSISFKPNSKSLSDFSKGIVLGTLLFAFIIAAISFLTPSHLVLVENPNYLKAILLSLACLLPQALMEEVAFRAYPLRRMKSVLRLRAAIYISAIGFALYHVVAGADLVGAFLGTGVWGLLFAYLAISSKGIALPLGLHFALNIIQAIIGMKEPYSSIWKFEDSVTASFPFTMDEVGLGVQLLILVTMVFLIERMVNKKLNLL